jgi:hypothetical protein
MRQILTFMVAFLAGGMVLAAVGSNAIASPLPALAAAAGVPGTIVKIDYWHRYYRQHGYGPDAIPVPVPVPQVEVQAPIADAPVVVVLPPPRPASCGEFHYWNGQACVDARYNNPYIGPR